MSAPPDEVHGPMGTNTQGNPQSVPLGHASGPDGAQEWGNLMAAAQAGHGGAYRRLLDEVRIWLNQYYAKRLPSPLVPDAVQDALIAIHEKRHTYSSSRPFKPWLHAIARYKWIDRLRQMSRVHLEPLDEDDEDLTSGNYEDSVLGGIVLDQLMATLKPAQADVIRLVKLHGLSVEEASTRTGQSVSLVKVNIHRGIARLSAMVQRQSDDE